MKSGKAQMSASLRSRISEGHEDSPERVGLREILGLGRANDGGDTEAGHLIELTLLGMRWMAALNVAGAIVICVLIGSSSQPFLSHAIATPLMICAALILCCDSLTFMPPFRRFLFRSKPVVAIGTLCALNLTTAACWSLSLQVATSSPWQISLFAASILGAGKLATMALPLVFAARTAAATLIFFFFAKDIWSVALIAGVSIFSIALVASFSAKRWSFLTEKSKTARDARIAGDLIHAFEKGGRGWFWGTDANGILTYVSPQLATQLGATIEQLDGVPFSSLFVTEAPGDFADTQVERTIGFTLTAGLEFRGLIVRSATAEDRWWSLSGTPTLDHRGNCVGFLGSGSDLTAERKSEANATKLALYDSLTGLPNRVLMRQMLDDLLRTDRQRQPSSALFLLDLDRFKNVNDTLGHPVGDALLKIVGQRLTRVVSGAGQVGRIGGDEFTVVIPKITDRVELAELASAIIARLSLPYVIGESTVQIGATIGVAVAPTDGVNPDELTRNADLALYAAKSAGKGTHKFYQPEMHADANTRRALENDLREVLTEQQLSVVYQPVVDAVTEEVAGFEALVRWNHPTRGMISPSIFIPIAEEIGLIGRIGDWVIREACAEAALWPEHLRVAVNLSPLQFASTSLPATLMRALAETGLAANRLELEVTEGVLLNDDAVTEKTFATITGMGVRLVLDDFGTGYASLGYLKRLPFSKIKIDRSFVNSAASEHGRSAVIIQAIVSLANSLGMETVAEGAETLGEIELIRSLGCSQIQGYIFGKPLSPSEARARALTSQSPDRVRELAETPREARTSLLRFAQMTSDGQTHNVKIRNISAGGAMIEAPPDAAIGPHVVVELGEGLSFSGEVRWRKENRFGIKLDEAIDVDQFVQASATRVNRLSSALAEQADDDKSSFAA
jgi:diguanylate cyclase (GGDEF)-like protein